MASLRRIRKRKCEHKIRHATIEGANVAIAMTRQAHPMTGWLTPYHCRFCNGYHIGHPNHEVKQAINARRYG